MAKRKHTSARGQQVDFDLLHHQNKDTIAIGNASMNANGDIIGRGGKIVRRVEDIPVENMANPDAAYNEANPKSTKMVSLKGKLDDLPEAVPATVSEDLAVTEVKEVKTEEKPKTKRKIIDSEE